MPNVFLIGLYWGKEKPENSNLFLKDLVDELTILSENGMQTSFGRKFVLADAFCCDAPAKISFYLPKVILDIIPVQDVQLEESVLKILPVF